MAQQPSQDVWNHLIDHIAEYLAAITALVVAVGGIFVGKRMNDKRKARDKENNNAV